MNTRQRLITKHIDLLGCGLEIAPLFRPVLPKPEYNVYYTDYAPAEELRKKNASNTASNFGNPPEIKDLDFVWLPGTRLTQAVPNGITFDYAIASHVIEHVPNMIGWLNEILSTLKIGGKIALVVPNKTACFDFYRQNTPVSEFVESWILNSRKPSPTQIFDCLSLAAVDTGTPGSRSFDLGLPLSEAPRTYTLDQALDYARTSAASNDYLDVHCSVFTPESFVSVISTIVELGLLNVSISDPAHGAPSSDREIVSSEFMVTLTKLGDPRVAYAPLITTMAAFEGTSPLDQLNPDLLHARQAFSDAVAIQNEMKAKIASLQAQIGFIPALGRVAQKILGRAS